MGKVKKCDKCGALESPGNPVVHLMSKIYLETKEKGQNYEDRGVHITMVLNSSERDIDVCNECKRKIVSSYFHSICGLIAPYRPDRAPGLDQSERREQLSGDGDREAVVAAFRRLLLTESTE